MNICIYGASCSDIDREYFEAARELGALIAENGHTLIFGGGRDGLMGAAASAAAELGGRVIGILPAEYNVPGIVFSRCTELIVTESVAERKRLMLEMADGFIALPGGLGTLDELFDALAQRQLGKHEKPIALLNTLYFFCALELVLTNCAKNGFMSRACLDIFTLCPYPEDALDCVLSGSGHGGRLTKFENYKKN